MLINSVSATIIFLSSRNMTLSGKASHYYSLIIVFPTVFNFLQLVGLAGVQALV